MALISGLVGCFVVWRRLSYYGESIAHSSLLGAGIGILIGIGIGNVLAVAVFQGSFIIPWTWIIAGVFFCIIIGLVSGFYPAFLAARQDPIEALRYE